MEHEAVAVRGEHEGDIERRGVVEALLHAVADAVGVVLGLDQRDRDVRLVVENVVGPLGLAARDQLAAHDDPALGEIDLLANLHHLVPPGALDGRQDELRADVAFGEASLVHRAGRILQSFKSKAVLARMRTDCTGANREPGAHPVRTPPLATDRAFAARIRQRREELNRPARIGKRCHRPIRRRPPVRQGPSCRATAPPAPAARRSPRRCSGHA